jgi:hypothetical protein
MWNASGNKMIDWDYEYSAIVGGQRTLNFQNLWKIRLTCLIVDYKLVEYLDDDCLVRNRYEVLEIKND